ncbi:MAG: hypothetical protein IKS98_14925 [Lachnospiraceae bacterium]|nr:hypothetical protein [Lachnospiraceae bacterium]
MLQKKGRKLLLKIAVALAAVAVLATLFAIPFRSTSSESEYTYSPIVPWYMISEEYNYFEEPSNAPLIGEWDFPARSVRRKLIIFGKEYRSEMYLEWKDGRVKRLDGV